ncbi:hypothetical protein [Candidatus Uabimicrobium sp. HlEnr_7]|uniref:hypothetical protein n=1 Tax=Candidatus Uabimicrobium helgolandensis TaxID=3095367 RepID=UPI003556B0CB
MNPGCFFYVVIGFSLFIIACTQTVFEDNNEPDEVIVHHSTRTQNINAPIERRSGLAIIKHEIQTDYPAGRAFAITVWNGGEIVQHDSRLPHGQYNLRIEKSGYKTIHKNIWIESDFEGKYVLTGILEAQERLINFNFLDVRTNTRVTPDTVTIADIGGKSESQIISDQSYVKPGSKIIVIQKAGYATFTQEIEIPVSPEPFGLSALLNPNS